jgi:hypothetical protein
VAFASLIDGRKEVCDKVDPGDSYWKEEWVAYIHTNEHQEKGKDETTTHNPQQRTNVFIEIEVHGCDAERQN